MDANMAALINRNCAINCQQENVKRYENGSFDEQHILSKNMYGIFLSHPSRENVAKKTSGIREACFVNPTVAAHVLGNCLYIGS